MARSDGSVDRTGDSCRGLVSKLWSGFTSSMRGSFRVAIDVEHSIALVVTYGAITYMVLTLEGGQYV